MACKRSAVRSRLPPPNRPLAVGSSPESPSSRGLGHRPFTAVTGVRIPLGTPRNINYLRTLKHWFITMQHARSTIEAWRVEYNTERTHGSLDDLTPEEFRHAHASGKIIGSVSVKAKWKKPHEAAFSSCCLASPGGFEPPYSP